MQCLTEVLQFGEGHGQVSLVRHALCDVSQVLQCLQVWVREACFGLSSGSHLVFNLVECQKISYEDARKELIKGGKGLCRRLKDLECWHDQSERLSLESHVLAVQTRIRANLQDVPRVPEIDAWQQKALMPDQPRKHILVLNGLSKLGKTEYVRSLFSVGSVL